MESVGITSEDAVVEIGPGLGQLTVPITARARRTIALEVDRGLVSALRERESWPGPFEVRHEDVLRADLGAIARELGDPVVLIGNLPYRISGRLLGALLGPRNPFRRWGFMLQLEVARRLLAPADSADYGTLSVWCALFARAEIALELGPEQFVPRPKVRSAFVVFDPPAEPPAVTDAAVLRRIVKASFQYRRKTLRRALAGICTPEALEAAEIDFQRRGETLEPLEFVALSNAMVDRAK